MKSYSMTLNLNLNISANSEEEAKQLIISNLNSIGIFLDLPEEKKEGFKSKKKKVEIPYYMKVIK